MSSPEADAPVPAPPGATPAGSAAATDGTAKHKRHPLRMIAGWVLVVLTAIFAALSVVGIFVRNQIVDTNRYVENVAPLAKDPAIQQGIVNAVGNALTDPNKVDLKSKVQQVLPAQLAILAGPIAQAVTQGAENLTRQVVQSDQFGTLWTDVNRNAHEQVIKLVLNKGTAVTNEDGKVTLNLQPLVAKVQEDLKNRGVPFIGSVDLSGIDARYELFSSKDLARVSNAVKFLDSFWWVLPVLFVLCAAGAIALFPNHRKGVVRAALATTVGMVVVLVGLAVGRQQYLNALPVASNNVNAASSIYMTLTRFLRTNARIVALIAIVVALVAILVGPSRFARWFQSLSRNATIAVQGVGLAVILLVLLQAAQLSWIDMVIAVILGVAWWLFVPFLGRLAPTGRAAAEVDAGAPTA